MAGGYKQAKEDFVSGMTGSSITHINLISLVALCSVSLYAAIRTRIPPTRKTGFFASWLVLVFPMLMSMTVSANHPFYLSLAIAVPTFFILRIPRTERGTPLPSSQPSSPAIPAVAATLPLPRDGTRWDRDGGNTKTKTRLPPLPALTTYRAHMMLMTVLAILAVDFPVFPRSLAKCETFGVSLMDLGVGSFVFSQGIVSAIPLVRDGSHLRAAFLPKLVSVTRKSLPIIALGLFRVILVKGTEYPEHVTEYGVHWNFFITLAVLPILQVFLHPLFLHIPIAMVGVLVAVVQQIILSQFGLHDYVLHAPRTSLVSANKEGLVSLLGYLSVQLLGLSIGTLVLPPTPSFYSRRQKYLLVHSPSSESYSTTSNNNNKNKKRRNSDPDPVDSDEEKEKDKDTEFDLAAPRELDKTATELCAYSILWWTLLGFVRLSGMDGGDGVSRRMVNMSYIFWVSAFNVSFLLCYVVVLDLWIFADGASSATLKKPKSKSNSKKTHQQNVSAPSSYFSLNVPEASHHLPQERHQTLNQPLSENPPRLLEVINRHGLIVFLLANVLTGLINLSISTMYASDSRAMLILSVYSIVCCGVPWLMTPRSTGSR